MRTVGDIQAQASDLVQQKRMAAALERIADALEKITAYLGKNEESVSDE